MLRTIFSRALFALALSGSVFSGHTLHAATHLLQSSQPGDRYESAQTPLGVSFAWQNLPQPARLAPALTLRGFAGATQAQSEQRHAEPAGGFSYIVPTGWQLQEVEQYQFKVVFARADRSRVVPNVFFIVGQPEGSLEAFKQNLLNELKTSAPGFALVGEEMLSTAQGSKVVKLVVNTVSERQQLRRVLYLIDGGDRILVAVYTRLRTSQQQNDAAVEAMIKTVEWLESSSKITSDGRHVEPKGGFSYVPPEGWTLTDDPSYDYRVLRRGTAFAAFVNLSFSRPLEEYSLRELANELSRGLGESFANVRLADASSFKTKPGYDALKFVFNATQRQPVQVTAYIVDLESVLVYVLYVRARIGSVSDDEAVESMVNTLAPVDASEPTAQPTRHYEQRGNFSYDVPSGWRTMRPEELGETQTEFAILVGPSTQDGISPAVRFYQDTLRGSLSAYVRSYVGTLRNDPSTRSLSSPEEFTTDNGIVGAYWMSEYVQANRRFYSAFYALPDGKRVIVAVYARPLQRGPSPLDEEFDAVMRSFRFGR